jgi:hypothetical protein
MGISLDDIAKGLFCRRISKRMQKGHGPLKLLLDIRRAGSGKRNVTELLRNGMLMFLVGCP